MNQRVMDRRGGGGSCGCVIGEKKSLQDVFHRVYDLSEKIRKWRAEVRIVCSSYYGGHQPNAPLLSINHCDCD